MGKIISFILLFSILGTFCVFGGDVSFPRITAKYAVDIEGFFLDLALFASPKYRRFRGLGLRMGDFISNGAVSLLDIKNNQIGYLDGMPDGKAYLLNPENGVNAEYNKEVLSKIHSFFAFAARDGNTLGSENFASFDYREKKTGKFTHHAVLLVLKDVVTSPVPGVKVELCANGTNMWRVAVWSLKSEHDILTRSNFYEKGKPNMYAEGYVLKNGPMRGMIMSLDIHTYRKDKVYLVRLVLTDISQEKKD